MEAEEFLSVQIFKISVSTIGAAFLTLRELPSELTQWLIAFLIHTPPMEDIHFLDPLPWNSADVDEFPSYPLEFRNFLQISSLPHGISTDF